MDNQPQLQQRNKAKQVHAAKQRASRNLREAKGALDDYLEILREDDDMLDDLLSSVEASKQEKERAKRRWDVLYKNPAKLQAEDEAREAIDEIETRLGKLDTTVEQDGVQFSASWTDPYVRLTPENLG